MLALLVFIGIVGYSVGGYLTRPGNDSVSQRVAEWGRDHHLGSLVTWLEQVQYSQNKPTKGGTIKGGLPQIKTEKPVTTKVQPDIPHTPLPEKPALLAGTGLPGEGVWKTVVVNKGLPAVQLTYVRPDNARPSRFPRSRDRPPRPPWPSRRTSHRPTRRPPWWPPARSPTSHPRPCPPPHRPSPETSPSASGPRAPAPDPGPPVSDEPDEGSPACVVETIPDSSSPLPSPAEVAPDTDGAPSSTSASPTDELPTPAEEEPLPTCPAPPDGMVDDHADRPASNPTEATAS